MEMEDEVYRRLYSRLFNTYTDVIEMLERSKITQEDVTDDVIRLLQCTQLACEEIYMEYEEDEAAVKDARLLQDPAFLKLSEEMYQQIEKEANTPGTYWYEKRRREEMEESY